MQGPPSDPAKLKFCAERGELLDRLHFAASEYCEALGDLSRNIPAVRSELFHLKMERVHETRLATARARAALVEHQDGHGCATLMG